MRIIKQVILIGFMFLCLGSNLIKANALTTETIYATNSNCTFSDSGKYKNVSSNGSISTNTINTTYNGKSYGMQFYFAEDMITTKVYQLKITFMADDLLPRVNENFIELITYDTSCESDYATILSIEKNTSSGNATTMTINFIPSMVSNKARILLGSSSGPIQITGETTFGIKSVQIGDRESQGNEQIIINQNKNTQDIINNQNQNAQDIQDTINDNLQEDCKNLLNNTLTTTSVNGVTYTVNADKSITLSGTATSLSYVLLSNQNNLHGVYTISGGSSLGQYIYMRGLNTNGYTVDIQTHPNIQGTANLNGNYVFYLYVAQGTNTNGITIYPQLKEGYNTIPYCAYGTKVSKIDETNNALNNLNDNLTNDSPIDVSSLGNTIGWLPAGPVDAIINLPLNMLNGLLTAFNKTCSPLSVPVPYLSQNVTIPCLSTIFAKINGLTDFWSWVGLIASVVILYKYLIALYDYYDHLTTLQANYLSDFGGAP